MSCGASLITGLDAVDAGYQQVSVVPAAPSSYIKDSAFLVSGLLSLSDVFARDLRREHSDGVAPRIRDIYASDRRLAGARLGFDLPGGRENEAGYGLLLVQTYGG
jgi:hypothetical protein